jgi:hypothetical protein
MAAIGTRSLTLTIDAVEYAAEVSSCKIISGETDSDFVSFADAAAGGGREYALALTFVQDATTASLWDQVWSHAGEEVPFVIRPYGNAVASAAQPHMSGTAIVSEPDGDLLGGEADPSPSNRFVTEVEWKCTEKPERVVA